MVVMMQRFIIRTFIKSADFRDFSILHEAPGCLEIMAVISISIG